MKLKRLELKNFGSHKHTVIDFEEEKLNKSPIVIITGNTGAGKSTLLDGITFVLYQESLRYSRSELPNIRPYNVQNEETSSCITIESKGVEYTIKRTLTTTTPNQNEYSVEITEKNNSRYYKHSGTKTTLDKRIVEKIMGCPYEVFKRSIVLPQGQFAALLKTDNPRDRRKIFQEIFPEVEIYRLIKEKIEKKLRETEENHKNIKKDIDLISQRFYEEISEISSSFPNYSSLLSNLNLNSPVTEIEKTKTYIIDNLNNTLKNLKTQRDELLDKKLIKTQEKTELENKIKQIQEITKINQELQKLEKKIAELIKKLFGTSIQQINETELEELKPKVSSQISVTSEEVQNAKKLKEYYIFSKQEYDNLKRSYEEIKNQIREKSREVIQRPLENRKQIQEEIQKLEKTLNEINETLKKITTKNIEEEEKELVYIEEKLKQIQKLENDLRLKREEINSVEKEIENVLKKMEEIKNQIEEKSKYEIEIYSQKIRNRLKEGDLCPVCGEKFSLQKLSQKTNESHETLDSQSIDKTAKDFKQIIDEIEKLNNEEKNLMSKKGILEGKREQLITTISSTQKELEDIKRSLKEAVEKIGITFSLESITETIEKKKQEISNLKKEVENLNNRIKEITTKKATLETLYDTADRFAKKLESDEKKLKTSIETFRNNEIFRKLFPNLLAIEQLSPYFENYVEEKINKYLEEAETRKSLLDELDKSISMFETNQNFLRNLKISTQEDENSIKSKISKIDEEVKEIENEIREKDEKISNLNNKIGEITTRLETLKKLSLEAQSKEKELKTIEEELNITKKLNENFNTQRIVNFVIKLKMDEIIETTNTYLPMLGIEDKKLSVNLEEENLEFSVKYSDTETLKPTDSLSGGESFLFSVALAFAIAKNVIDTLKINSLFIDEGFDTLDENYNSRVLNFLESFAQEKNITIYIITHKQEIFENTNFPKIEVFKEDGISKIKIISKKLLPN